MTEELKRLKEEAGAVMQDVSFGQWLSLCHYILALEARVEELLEKEARKLNDHFFGDGGRLVIKEDGKNEV